MKTKKKQLTYKEARNKLFDLTVDDLGDMHYKEVLLILAMRSTFRWGPIEIQVKDGVPIRILRAFESLDMDNIDLETLNDIIK